MNIFRNLKENHKHNGDINEHNKKEKIETIELKNIIGEMRTSLDEINSRLDIKEEKITKFKVNTIENIKTKMQRKIGYKKMKRTVGQYRVAYHMFIWKKKRGAK